MTKTKYTIPLRISSKTLTNFGHVLDTHQILDTRLIPLRNLQNAWTILDTRRLSSREPLKNPPPRDKICPRGAPEKPRGAYEALKRAQEPPNSVQKVAKWRPRAAQDSLRPLQNRARRVPKRVFSILFDGTRVWQAVSTIL